MDRSIPRISLCEFPELASLTCVASSLHVQMSQGRLGDNLRHPPFEMMRESVESFPGKNPTDRRRTHFTLGNRRFAWCANAKRARDPRLRPR